MQASGCCKPPRGPCSADRRSPTHHRLLSHRPPRQLSGPCSPSQLTQGSTPVFPPLHQIFVHHSGIGSCKVNHLLVLHCISGFPGSAFLLFHTAHSGSLSFTHKSCLLSKGSDSVLDFFRTETLWSYCLMICSLSKLRHSQFHWTIPDTPRGYLAASRAVVILQLWFCRAGSSAPPSAHRWSRYWGDLTQSPGWTQMVAELISHQPGLLASSRVIFL